MTTNVTIAAFKAWAKANKQLAVNVIEAQAVAEVTREKVDAYIEPLFKSFGFVISEGMHRTDAGKPIEKAQDIYLCNDEEKVAQFFAACDAAHKANGFTVKAGYCPALIAENELIKAQNKLIEAASKLFDVDFSFAFGAKREELLKLLLGICLEAGKP